MPTKSGWNWSRLDSVGVEKRRIRRIGVGAAALKSKGSMKLRNCAINFKSCWKTAAYRRGAMRKSWAAVNGLFATASCDNWKKWNEHINMRRHGNGKSLNRTHGVWARLTKTITQSICAILTFGWVTILPKWMWVQLIFAFNSPGIIQYLLFVW